MPRISCKKLFVVCLSILIGTWFLYSTTLLLKKHSSLSAMEQIIVDKLHLYKNMLHTKQFSTPLPIKLHFFIDPGYFDFWFQQDTTKECAVPCTPVAISQWNEQQLLQQIQNKQMDALLLHDSSNQPLFASSALQGEMNVEFLQLKLRNEADHKFNECHLYNGHTCANAMTINYQREATIWGNYMYLKPAEELRPTAPTTVQQYQSACTFISNCVPHRIAFVQQMMTQVSVRNYGYCLKNVGEGEVKKMEEMKHCRFNLAFENTLTKDYVTEKFLEPFFTTPKANTIIVYRGSSFVKEYFKEIPKFYIDVMADFNDDPIALANYLKYLLTNQTAYDEYFEWQRNETWYPIVKQKLMYMHQANVIASPCKICLAIAEMKESRKLLQEFGLRILPNEYKVRYETFLEWKRDILKQVNEREEMEKELDEVYDKAYGRAWRENNYMSDWNNLENAKKKSGI